MESLVGYGSDDESGENYQDNRKYGVGKSMDRMRQGEDDVNYDNVQMDMSEESNNNHTGSSNEDDSKSSSSDGEADKGKEGLKSLPNPPKHRDDKHKDRYERDRHNRDHEVKERLGSHGRDRAVPPRDRDYRDKEQGKNRDRERDRDRAKRDDRRSKSRDKDRKRSRSRDRSSKKRSHSPVDKRSSSRHRDEKSARYRRSPHSKDRDRDRDRRSSTSRDRDRDRDRDRGKSSSSSSGSSRRGSYDKKPSKLTILERLGIELRPPEAPPAVTPQQLLQKSIEQQVQQVKSNTGIELPKYYNPAAMNPARYAEQMQKRKLLWGNKAQQEVAKPAAAPASNNKWEGTTFAQDQDGKMTAKFKRLMGIKDGGGSGNNTASASSSGTNPEGNEILKKQEELFNSMEMQYEVARVATHTHRGVGLGFGTFQYPR